MDLLKQLVNMIDNGYFITGRIYEINLKGSKPFASETIYGVCAGCNSFDICNTWVKFYVITDAEKREVFYLNESNLYRLVRVCEVKLKRFSTKANAFHFE